MASIPTIEYRPLRIEDYPATVALWERCDGIGSPESPELFARFLARNPDTSQSAWSDGRLVGAVLVGFDGKRAYLYHLAVDGDFRRRGVAGTMLERALSAVEAQGVEKATIFLLTDNELGRSFWEGRGWIERNDLIIFQKPLT